MAIVTGSEPCVPITDMTRVGDTLQSAGSRLAEFVFQEVERRGDSVPYEVHMAALEIERAKQDWTAIRSKMKS